MTSAELITELQSARPSADADLRERIRAIAATKPAQRPNPFERLSRLSPRRLALVVVPATAVVALAVAGGAGLLDARTPTSAPAMREMIGTSAAPPTAAGKALATTAPAAADTATTPAPAPGRAQSYSAQLSLTVKDTDALSAATQQALRITRDLGGHLVSVSYATSQSGTSNLLLKVPTENVQEAIVRLSGLGKIASQQVQIDDLQDQVDALTRREAVLREQIARLSARIADPATDSETKAALEARRDAARAELTRLRVTHAQVNAEAREATIQLTLQTSQTSVVPVAPSRWHRALERAQEILAVEAEILLATLVVVGPLALLGVLVVLGRRAIRRRRDDELLATR